MTYQHINDKPKKPKQYDNHEGNLEKKSDTNLKEKKYKNEYKRQKGMK
jgi:hypothetical protein